MPYEYCIREKKTEEILGVFKDLDDAVKGLADQEAHDKYHDLYEPDSYEIEEFNPEIWDFDPDRASNIGSDDIDIW